MKPFFSIIIPTLNEEKYLPNLLKALQHQLFSSFEVLVIDGKSTDKTSDILHKSKKTFQKKGIKLKWFITTKRSSAIQRNLGAKKANAQYLVFFDADVIPYPDFLQTVHNHLINKNWQNNLITSWARSDQNTLADWLITFLFLLIVEIGRLIGKPFSIGFNTVIKKSLFLKIGGFDPLVSVAEDYDFSLRAKKLGYELKIIRPFKIHFSLRRFRSHGWLKTLFEYFKMTLYNLFLGPTRKKIFNYPMGGDVHQIKN